MDREDLERSSAAGFQGAGTSTEAVAYHATDDESRNTKKYSCPPVSLFSARNRPFKNDGGRGRMTKYAKKMRTKKLQQRVDRDAGKTA